MVCTRCEDAPRALPATSAPPARLRPAPDPAAGGTAWAATRVAQLAAAAWRAASERTPSAACRAPQRMHCSGRDATPSALPTVAPAAQVPRKLAQAAQVAAAAQLAASEDGAGAGAPVIAGETIGFDADLIFLMACVYRNLACEARARACGVCMRSPYCPTGPPTPQGQRRRGHSRQAVPGCPAPCPLGLRVRSAVMPLRVSTPAAPAAARPRQGALAVRRQPARHGVPACRPRHGVLCRERTHTGPQARPSSAAQDTRAAKARQLRKEIKPHCMALGGGSAGAPTCVFGARVPLCLRQRRLSSLPRAGCPSSSRRHKVGGGGRAAATAPW